MNLDHVPRKHEKLGQLLERSSVMQQVFKQLKKAATVDMPILLQGETGTGKDLAAQAIHRMSAHHEGPYIPINLSAPPSEMVASELFGHKKGAFYRAMNGRVMSEN
jgi:DNA-binding NtrC family response regulator